jgi:hypothetical protein
MNSAAGPPGRALVRVPLITPVPTPRFMSRWLTEGGVLKVG